MTIRYYRDSNNNYLGASNLPIENGIQVSSAPLNADATWNGSTWVEPSNVPSQVSMRQARLALLSQGHLTNAENALNGLSEPDRSAALIEWEYALSVDRNSTLVQTMITLLGLTTQEADDLFTLAASL